MICYYRHITLTQSWWLEPKQQSLTAGHTQLTPTFCSLGLIGLSSFLCRFLISLILSYFHSFFLFSFHCLPLSLFFSSSINFVSVSFFPSFFFLFLFSFSLWWVRLPGLRSCIDSNHSNNNNIKKIKHSYKSTEQAKSLTIPATLPYRSAIISGHVFRPAHRQWSSGYTGSRTGV